MATKNVFLNDLHIGTAQNLSDVTVCLSQFLTKLLGPRHPQMVTPLSKALACTREFEQRFDTKLFEFWDSVQETSGGYHVRF